MAVTNSTELVLLYTIASYNDLSSYIAVHDVYMQLRYLLLLQILCRPLIEYYAQI